MCDVPPPHRLHVHRDRGLQKSYHDLQRRCVIHLAPADPRRRFHPDFHRLTDELL